jgi:hypothetical protein
VQTHARASSEAIPRGTPVEAILGQLAVNQNLP